MRSVLLAAALAVPSRVPLSAPLTVPRLAAPVLPPSALVLPVPSALPSAAAPVFSPAPVPEPRVLAALLKERGWADHGPYRLVLREGTDSFGRRVFVIDAVERVHPERGTLAHVDFAAHDRYGQASLDGPLDSAAGATRAPGIEGADLSHWREHLWFGLAVLPELQGQGMGKLLLDTAMEMLRERGIPELWIRATETSHSFYEKHLSGRIAGIERTEDRDGDAYYLIHVRL